MRDPGPCWRRRKLPVRGPGQTDAGTASRQCPGVSCRAPGTRPSLLRLVFPFHLLKLLREEEKEKYAEMAREWRAAQGKDSGPSEKQVKLTREQPPASQVGVLSKCWMSEWINVKSRRPGDLGECKKEFFIFFLVSECLLKNGQAPELGHALVLFDGEGQGKSH